MDSQETSQELPFSADRPIESSEQDLLGRRTFAENIAHNILSVPADHGFTVAIVGEWGSGKSSVLNMVKESIEADSDFTAVVLQFNPWLFGSADDLVPRFFRELGAQLGKKGKEQVKAVVSALIELGKGLSPIIPVPGVSAAANAVGDLAEKALGEKSLLEQRDQLYQSLVQLESRVIVIIDDIDRLEPTETRELMRLVRLTSDLPNVVFLLAFDWQHVSLNLRDDEDDGSHYLDKIVQIRYDLPLIRKTVLSEVLIESLRDLQEEYEVLELESNVWHRIHDDVIRPLLYNLRDVRRFVNSLHVTLDTLGMEVALADLLGLEAIRVMAPRMFETIRSHPELLVRRDNPLEPYSSGQARQEAIHRMLSEETDAPFGLKTVLDILFPASMESDGILFLGGRESEWRKSRRVACEEVLQIYLLHQISKEALENIKVEAIIEDLIDEQRLADTLDALNGDQFEEALERVEAYESEFPSEAIPIAVPILANRLRRLSPRMSSPFALPPKIKGTRVILRLLRRESDQDRLFACLAEVLEKVESLSSWLEIVEMVGPNENVGHKLVNTEQAKDLEGRLATRLEEATSEELGMEWNLIPLLVRPAQWLPGERATQLYNGLKEHLNDEGFLLTLLRAVVGTPTPNSFGQIAYNWDPLVEVFGDALPAAVREMATPPFIDSLSPEDQRIVSLAKDYADGWRPDDDWGSPW